MDTSVEPGSAPSGSTDDSGEFVWYHDLVWKRRPGGASPGEGAAGAREQRSPGRERVVCVKLSNGRQVQFGIQSGEQLKRMIDSLERAM